MDSVVVTAARGERRLADVAVPVVVVSWRDMERSGVETVAQALENELPGLVFTPDAMGNNLRLRGLTTRYVLFLVDGERMVGEGAGGNVNLDRVAVGEIERIEVVGGSAAALWGAGAVGAVVNIITKKDSKGVSAKVGAGNNGVLRAGAGAGWEWGSADVFRNSSEGRGATSPWTDVGGSVRVGMTKKRVETTLKGRFLSHETFNPPRVMNATHNLTRSFGIGFSARAKWFETSIGSDNFFDYTVGGKEGKRRDNRASLLWVRVLGHWDIGAETMLTGGVEANHEDAFSRSTLGKKAVTREMNDAALFARAEKSMGKWRAVLGARYTHSGAFGGAFSPTAAAMFRQGKFVLRGSVAASFRPPSIRERYYDFDHQGMFWIVGNPALDAEKGVYAQLSGEFSGHNTVASVTAYLNNISNKITQYEVAGERLELHYKNVGSASIRGVEFNGRWFAGRRWAFRGGYNFCDARDNSTDRQLLGNPRHSATWSATWTGVVAAQAGGRFLGSYDYLDISGDARKMSAQTLWRIAVSRTWRRFTLAGRVENLFDERTVATPLGREFLMTLKYAI